jgi:poly(A) polymerase
MLSVRQMKQSTLRRLVGAPTFPLDLELHRLDCLASHGDLGNYEFLLEFSKRIAQEPVLPPPWINGVDIMAQGIPEGREVGLWRNRAYDAQLEGRFATREELLTWLAGEIAGTGKRR